MKKYLIGFIILLISVFCLLSCNNTNTTNTQNNTDISNNVNSDIYEYDVTNINNFRCEIILGETKESYVLEGIKAKELYNIILNYERTSINGIPAYDSIDPSKDYIYLLFSAEKIENSENPIEQLGHYGWYTIYMNEIVSHNLSPLMSASWEYQFESGVYSEVKSYIENEM